MKSVRTYRWVHVEEHVTIELERKKELLEDIGFKFEKNNEKFREYHVDTHLMFASVQPTTRPL